MGRDKALIEVDGVPMARRVADALEEGRADPVLCIGGDQAALEALGLEFLADDRPGEGPLGGLLTALEWAEGMPWDAVVVSACDHPWLDGEPVEQLLYGLNSAPLARPATGPWDGDTIAWRPPCWRSRCQPRSSIASPTTAMSTPGVAAAISMTAGTGSPVTVRPSIASTPARRRRAASRTSPANRR